MSARKLLLLSCFFAALTCTLTRVHAQQSRSADDLLTEARKKAFDEKNYPAAIELCQQALIGSPGYTDIRVFLGRLFYWNNQADSSQYQLALAVKNDPAHEDAALAAATISYYEEKYPASLGFCEAGLRHHPLSADLALQKAKTLAAMRQFRQAARLTDSLLKKNPSSDLLRLADRIKDQAAANKIGISYDYTHFSRQFDQAWHLVSLDYSRQTTLGSVIGRINYGNRFGSSAVQFELDAYPHIARNLYAYVNIGYSPDLPLFSKFRSGFSLYANLPKGFEADLGFRYLRFNDDTWIYTGALGKYYKNFWFNLRAYITPDNQRISQSYALTGRYYVGGADDYLAVSIGSGISPDDRSQAIQLNNNYKLITRKASATYRFSHKNLNIFTFGLGYANVEYLPKTRDNQLNINAGYQRRF